MIKGALEDGLQPEYSLDLFGVNLASQFVLCFTRYGWWIYALVPGYIGQKILKFIWGYLSRTTEKVEEEPIDPKEAKRLAKKQKEEGKQRVKYMKR